MKQERTDTIILNRRSVYLFWGLTFLFSFLGSVLGKGVSLWW